MASLVTPLDRARQFQQLIVQDQFDMDVYRALRADLIKECRSIDDDLARRVMALFKLEEAGASLIPFGPLNLVAKELANPIDEEQLRRWLAQIFRIGRAVTHADARSALEVHQLIKPAVELLDVPNKRLAFERIEKVMKRLFPSSYENIEDTVSPSLIAKAYREMEFLFEVGGRPLFRGPKGLYWFKPDRFAPDLIHIHGYRHYGLEAPPIIEEDIEGHLICFEEATPLKSIGKPSKGLLAQIEHLLKYFEEEMFPKTFDASKILVNQRNHLFLIERLSEDFGHLNNPTHIHQWIWTHFFFNKDIFDHLLKCYPLS